MSIRSELGQTKLAQAAAKWMTDNRGLVVAATALPASFVFERGRVTRAPFLAPQVLENAPERGLRVVVPRD